MVDSYALLAAKKEATYNFEIVPTLAANAILTRNLKWTPVEVDMLERDLDLASRGATPGVPTNKRQPFSFECELQGGGAAGTAPRWMELLEACGMAAPVLTATVKAEQRFALPGVALSSLTAYSWTGNQFHKTTGARGDFGFDFSAGRFPFLNVDYTGLIPATFPRGVLAPGVPTFTAWPDPLEVNTANTSFTLDGYAAVLKTFKGSANADIKLRNLVGANYIQRGNHKMRVTLEIEAPSYNSKDYFATLSTGSRIAVQLVHGTVAGFIVQIDSANLQITKISQSKEDDILMYSIEAMLTITGAGADDLLLTAK